MVVFRFALLEVELQTDEGIGVLLGFIADVEAGCRYQQNDDVLGSDVSVASLSIILFFLLNGINTSKTLVFIDTN